MKKNLTENVYQRIKNMRSRLINLEIGSYEFEKTLREFQNLISLKDYAEFLYNSGLLLTDINAYRNENNISPEKSDEEMKTEFIKANTSKQKIFDEIIYTPISASDLSIHKLMSTENGYTYLSNASYRVNSLLEEINSLTGNFSFGYNMPIKGLEALESKDIKLSISELLDLKEKVKTARKRLPIIQNALLNYSPEFLDNILKDNYSNNVERLNAIFTIILLDPRDPVFDKYVDLRLKFKGLYEEYRKLTFKAKFSSKAKDRLHVVVNNIIDIYEEAVPLLKETITNRNAKLLSYFGTYFKNTTTNYQVSSIDEFIDTLKSAMNKINAALDELLNQKDNKQEEIKQILKEVSEKSGIIVTDAEEFTTKDLFESYRKVNLRETARTLDRLSTKEIIESYGHVSDEHIYRIMPIK